MALTLGNVDVQLTNAALPVITASISGQLAILKATACNTDIATRLLTLYRVQQGGTAGATNLVLDAEPIAPGATMTLPLNGQTLNNSQTIQALADVASKVNLSIAYAVTS